MRRNSAYWRRRKELIGDRDPMVDSKPFVTAMVEATIHARRTAKRDYLMDCSVERVGLFVVSLRRLMKGHSYSRHTITELCQCKMWLDACVPSDRIPKQYISLIEEARMTADAQETKSMSTLNSVLESENEIIHNMKKANEEADKLFAEIKVLCANI